MKKARRYIEKVSVDYYVVSPICRLEWKVGLSKGPDYISKTAKSHLFPGHILGDIQKGIYIFGPEKDMCRDKFYSIIKLKFKNKGYDEEIIDVTKLWETV